MPAWGAPFPSHLPLLQLAPSRQEQCLLQDPAFCIFLQCLVTANDEVEASANDAQRANRIDFFTTISLLMYFENITHIKCMLI